MNADKKGFGLAEMLIVIVILGLLSTVGWLVYDRQNNKEKDNEPQKSSQQDQASLDDEAEDITQTIPEISPVEVKTVTYESGSVSFELPEGWTHMKVDTVDTPLHYIIDPTNQLQLELKIDKKEETGSSTNNLTSLDSFSGNSEKTYYLHGYTGNSQTQGAYEIIQLSLCKDNYCHQELRNDFELNLAIRSSDFTTGVMTTDPILEDIKQIVQSIKY